LQEGFYKISIDISIDLKEKAPFFIRGLFNKIGLIYSFLTIDV